MHCSSRPTYHGRHMETMEMQVRGQVNLVDGEEADAVAPLGYERGTRVEPTRRWSHGVWLFSYICLPDHWTIRSPSRPKHAPVKGDGVVDHVAADQRTPSDDVQGVLKEATAAPHVLKCALGCGARGQSGSMSAYATRSCGVHRTTPPLDPPVLARLLPPPDPSPRTAASSTPTLALALGHLSWTICNNINTCRKII